jgi:hypothetical protein
MPEKDFGGIIILGGAIEGGEIAMDRGEVSIYSSAERVTKAFEFIRKYPDLPFIFSGFSGRISPVGMSEADAFKQLVAEQGLPGKNAHYESQSRNTYENVVFMKPVIIELGAKSAKEANTPGSSRPDTESCSICRARARSFASRTVSPFPARTFVHAGLYCNGQV